MIELKPCPFCGRRAIIDQWPVSNTLYVVPAATLKKPIKQKSSSTLHNMTKAELIEYIRCLEQNYNAAVWFNENQARYIEQLGLVKKEQEVY